MSAQKQATFKIWRGDASGGQFRDYTTGVSEGMVVLDAVNHVQATQANDLACRWNCKAGKCGSCSAEINGMPKLMCMARLSDLALDKQDYALAAQNYEKAAKLDPAEPDAHYGLARAFATADRAVWYGRIEPGETDVREWISELERSTV
jgi:hypothetical protein